MSRNGFDIDQRSRRTRDALARALIALSRDKPVDEISIGELTEAAGVGRSTFYSHFSNLSHFLCSSYASMLERSVRIAQQQTPEAVLPTKLIFEHLARSGDFGSRIRISREWPAMLAAGRARLMQILGASLAESHPTEDAQRRRWASVFITGALIGMVEEWTGAGRVLDPGEVDDLYKEFAEAVLSAVPGIVPETQFTGTAIAPAKRHSPSTTGTTRQ